MAVENDSGSDSQGLDGEAASLDHAVERLSERFPDVPRTHIEELVKEHQEQYNGAPVRDFVPVLVEHDAKKQLRAETASSRSA